MKTSNQFLTEKGLGNTRLGPNYNLSDLLDEYAKYIQEETIKRCADSLDNHLKEEYDVGLSDCCKQSILNIERILK